MKYMLLIYGAESCWTEEERTECMLKSMSICDELDAQGKWIDSAPLHSVTTAMCVRVRDGQRLVTDGPYAETTLVNEQRFNCPGLVGRMRSCSYMPTREHPRYQRMIAALRALFARHQVDGQVTFTYDVDVIVGQIV